MNKTYIQYLHMSGVILNTNLSYLKLDICVAIRQLQLMTE